MTVNCLLNTLFFSLKLRELHFRFRHTTKRPHSPAYVEVKCELLGVAEQGIQFRLKSYCYL